jgi:hypothetical protein
MQLMAPSPRLDRQHVEQSGDLGVAKLNHQKRSRPRPAAQRRRRHGLTRAQDLRTRRELERWRRAS